MTANKRIFLNVIATYGRSLFGLFVGIFTSRWVLMALGETDYGLYNVVGGLTAFIALFNNLMSSAVGRYYAFAVGRATTLDGANGVEECRRWFNTAVSVHTIVPIILMIVGYPIAESLVRHWLVIPPDRIDSCVKVLRFACFSCFIGMLNVPYQAMYYAKQYIAELTIYSFAQSFLNIIFFYYMMSHPRDWLVNYAAWCAAVICIPQAIICIRALIIFPECRYRLSYWFDFGRLRSLSAFAFWQAIGNVGNLFKTQGISMLINKYYGPSVNAAMAIGNTVNQQASSLSVALQTAFFPVITGACGAGDLAQMRKMAFRSCKFGLLLSLIFVLPLSVELHEVMRLWLKKPPMYASGLCLCALITLLIDKSTIGHMVAVNANGEIAKYQVVVGGFVVMTLPLAWIFVALGFHVYFVGVAIIIAMGLSSLGRVYFARKLVGMSVRHWVQRIVLPSFVVSVMSIMPGLINTSMLSASFLRVVGTSFLVELTLLPSAYWLLLEKEERVYFREKLGDMVRRIRR